VKQHLFGLVLLALVVAAAAACGNLPVGDPGYSVTVKNGTELTITYFVDDVGAKPGDAVADGVRLSPGADDVDHWLIPSGPQDNRRAKVRAMTSSGTVYYCHRFGFDELKKIQFNILIGPGVNDCG
jgi:ABC-type glycerol-3-phosphate transport system substrate-binding protein